MRRDALEQPLSAYRPAQQASKDVWFNPSISPANARADAVVAPVLQALEQHGRKRALRATDRATQRKVLIPVVANLIHHYLIGRPGEGIPVPRSNRDEALGGKGSRYQPFVFPRSWPKMLNSLGELGFAEQCIGKYSSIPGKSKRTTIRAGAKLIKLIEDRKVALEDLYTGLDTEEIVILKRPKRGFFDEGKRVDYDDDETTRRYREELRAINAWLASADIRFDAATAGYDQPVNVKARRLYRSFTMGGFDSGGRLFGGFWENLPKGVRLRGISIEGEHVIGLDYSQLNPRLAYSLAKAQPPAGDAYSLPGLENRREGVKKVFNAMLFDDGPRSRFPRGARKLFPSRVIMAEVTAAIFERHQMLKGVLSAAGIGHTLMFLESKIMMAVLRRCQKKEIIALPVFDCVVVKASAADTAKAIMQEEFKAVAGLNVEVRKEIGPTML
jgi:hypothetical protein